MIDFIEASAIAMQARVPVLFEGAPGDAKTDLVEALLKQLTRDHETIVLAVREPADVGGYPVDTPDGMALKPTRWAYRLATAGEHGPVGLFLDELTSAPPAVRAAALRGIREGVWGEIRIPNLAIVSAQNPPELAEGGYGLSAAMANRFCHLKWEFPIAEWATALMNGFQAPVAPKLPENWRARIPATRAWVATFAQRNPGAIRAVPSDAAMQSGPWPSLRTWTFAAELLAACQSLGYDLLAPWDGKRDRSAVPGLLLHGCVGAGAAGEFLEWVNHLDLPDPEKILAEPCTRLPERQDQLFALLAAVASAVLGNNTVDRWNQAWEVLGYVAEENKADVAFLSARMLLANRPVQGIKAPHAISKFEPLLKAAGMR